MKYKLILVDIEDKIVGEFLLENIKQILSSIDGYLLIHLYSGEIFYGQVATIKRY